MGDKRENLLKAVALLAERAGNIPALSSLYETQPWGFTSPNTFLNAALLLETALPPLQRRDATRRIATEMGRTAKSNGAYSDRPIDIDILLYDNLVLQTPCLTLPHPLMHQRAFVLQPLAEIAPHTLHPILLKTINQLLHTLSG
jgi:2-amino-4-hydroxy-6-hydroxymethyldihydropteridine diphosphokinase